MRCEYRNGHFREAAEWAEKSTSSERKEAQGHAYGVLAMACVQLGKKDETRTAIAKGEELAPAVMPARVVEDTVDVWLACLFARVQLDEAITLPNERSPAFQKP